MKRLNVLLVNPYIYDVSAYGFWSAPLGLMYIGGILKQNGMEVALLDCLQENDERRKDDGRAPFIKKRVESPEPAKGISKKFKRYGLSQCEVEEGLSAVGVPDLILITSIMTYWYKGAEEVAHTARNMFPSSRIVVGGIYPSLCYGHARNRLTEADLIVRNQDLDRFYSFVEEALCCTLTFRPGLRDFARFPRALFDLYKMRHFVPLLTSLGCVYHCTYCATSYLYPFYVRRSVASVIDEVIYWYERATTRFALYDDSFLYNCDSFAKPFLRAIAGLPFPVTIYNPNALNASLLDEETSFLLRAAGFQEVRLGLETADPSLQASTGGKLNRRTFERAVRFLRAAGFPPDSIRVYVLSGLPFQPWETVKQTVDYAYDVGVKVDLAQYTPIPHTVMFEKFSPFARYPIAEEPLFQNNALLPFAWEGFTEEDMNVLKQYVREKNGVATNRGADLNGGGSRPAL